MPARYSSCGPVWHANATMHRWKVGIPMIQLRREIDVNAFAVCVCASFYEFLPRCGIFNLVNEQSAAPWKFRVVFDFDSIVFLRFLSRYVI